MKINLSGGLTQLRPPSILKGLPINAVCRADADGLVHLWFRVLVQLGYFDVAGGIEAEYRGADLDAALTEHAIPHLHHRLLFGRMQ
jgi:hypothetical protein